MATSSRLSFAKFIDLPESEGVVYELDQGELLREASPTLRHNLVRQQIAVKLIEFVKARELGLVVEEMDFRLSAETVRNPDVAFIDVAHAKDIDLDRSPVDCAPTLAVEVVSPHNRADDMARKTHQYLEAGCRVVWLVYPSLRMVEVHSKDGVRQVREPEVLREDTLFPGLALSLSYLFEVGKLGR